MFTELFHASCQWITREGLEENFAHYETLHVTVPHSPHRQLERQTIVSIRIAMTQPLTAASSSSSSAVAPGLVGKESALQKIVLQTKVLDVLSV